MRPVVIMDVSENRNFNEYGKAHISGFRMDTETVNKIGIAQTRTELKVFDLALYSDLEDLRSIVEEQKKQIEALKIITAGPPKCPSYLYIVEAFKFSNIDITNMDSTGIIKLLTSLDGLPFTVEDGIKITQYLVNTWRTEGLTQKTRAFKQGIIAGLDPPFVKAIKKVAAWTRDDYATFVEKDVAFYAKSEKK